MRASGSPDMASDPKDPAEDTWRVSSSPELSSYQVARSSRKGAALALLGANRQVSCLISHTHLGMTLATYVISCSHFRAQ